MNESYCVDSMLEQPFISTPGRAGKSKRSVNGALPFQHVFLAEVNVLRFHRLAMISAD
jgi:hypothetical protein